MKQFKLHLPIHFLSDQPVKFCPSIVNYVLDLIEFGHRNRLFLSILFEKTFIQNICIPLVDFINQIGNWTDYQLIDEYLDKVSLFV